MNGENGKEKGKKPLSWSMVSMLLFGWFVPLILMILIMVFLVSGKINKQVEHTIKTSNDKAVEICELRIKDSVTASKNASYITTVRDAYHQYQQDENHQKLSNSVNLFLGQQYKYNDNFKTAVLFFTERPERIYFTYNTMTYATYNNVKDFQDGKLLRVIHESETLDTGTKLLDIGDKVYLIRNLMDSKFHPFAVLTMEINTDALFGSLESVWGYEDHLVYINNERVEDMTESRREKYFPELDQIETVMLEEASEKSQYYRMDKCSYISRQVPLDGQQITFLISLNNKELYAQMRTVGYIFAMLLVFMIPLLIQVVLFFYRKVTKPLQIMVAAAHTIEEGHYGEKIESAANSEEFYYMEEAFNRMSEQLQNQFERIYLEEIALRDARIMALQSQINPHFLNNTLEIINWEARLNKNYKVSGMIEALSTMLEATMNRKKESLISLTEELNYMDAYLFIISQRFGEKFAFYKEIEEDLLDIKVPRLIIQPIVENAVEHGMDISKCGEVWIRVYQIIEEGKIVIEVEDNGILTKKQQEKIDHLLKDELDVATEKRVSLGIRNVDQRLKILYGKESGLLISSNEKNHTVSCVVIKI